MDTSVKVCTRCGETKSVEDFYFVSRKLGTRRGQCKPCMAEIKAAQKDPDWKPMCCRCGQERERAGSGRRLCAACFHNLYESEETIAKGLHQRAIKPCSICGVERLRNDHIPGTTLCPICRSVPQGRRKRLKEFNLTPREFLALLDKQGHKCAICHRKPTKSLHIDHQHGEGHRYVRGLVCARCNNILALAKDQQDVLANAATYLAHPSAQQLFPGRQALPAADRRQHHTLRYAK